MSSHNVKTLIVGFWLIAVITSGCGGGGDSDLIPPFTLTTSIAVGDLNADGEVDLAVSGIYIAGEPPHPSHISVIFQDPLSPGAFLPAVNFSVGSDTQQVRAGDLNDDGFLDLVAANLNSHNISVLFQDSTTPGHYLPAVNYASGLSPNGVAIGDLDGDGHVDLAVADVGLSILFQDPNLQGTFLPAVSLGVRSSSVAIGDLNGDGEADLVVADPGSSKVSVLLQDPITPGDFSAPVSFAAGFQPYFVAIGDLNGDTLPDLAVANLGTPDNPSTSSVSVLLQDPTTPGSFLSPTNYATGNRSQAVAIGDLNDDGRLDLSVANAGLLSNTGSVSVLLQDPITPGAFGGVVNYPGISQPLSVDIDDLNGDALPDLAVADDGASIRFQDPTTPGGFLPPVRVGD